MKHLHRFVRRAAAFVLAAALCVCVLAPAASAATTIGGAAHVGKSEAKRS